MLSYIYVKNLTQLSNRSLVGYTFNLTHNGEFDGSTSLFKNTAKLFCPWDLGQARRSVCQRPQLRQQILSSLEGRNRNFSSQVSSQTNGQKDARFLGCVSLLLPKQINTILSNAGPLTSLLSTTNFTLFQERTFSFDNSSGRLRNNLSQASSF